MARKAKTKKQVILDYCEKERLATAGFLQVRALQEELRRQFGAKGKISFSYVARVLQEAGVPVQYASPYVDPPIDEPYAGRLKGILRFHSLEEAEVSLRDLDSAYRMYGEALDRAGISLVRSILLKGRQRAESLAANPRISFEKRREKREIASWFRVWLQTPDLFFDWLEIRKRSEEFRQQFGGRPESK